MALEEAARRRVEERVREMILELRAKPTQAKEDRLGLAIATMPAEEREFASAVLLRIVAEERDGVRA